MDKKTAIEEVIFTRKKGKWIVKYKSTASKPLCPLFGDYGPCEKCGYWRDNRCVMKPEELTFEGLIYRVMKNAKKRNCLSITIRIENRNITKGSNVF